MHMHVSELTESLRPLLHFLFYWMVGQNGIPHWKHCELWWSLWDWKSQPKDLKQKI